MACQESQGGTDGQTYTDGQNFSPLSRLLPKKDQIWTQMDQIGAHIDQDGAHKNQMGLRWLRGVKRAQVDHIGTCTDQIRSQAG